MVPELGDVNASMLFIQPHKGKADAYSDMVLQSKQILERVSQRTASTRKDFIVDNSLLTFKHKYRQIEGCGNLFLYDIPKQSMQKGGIFFPDATSPLCTDVLRWSLDTIFHQVAYDAQRLLNDMENTVLNAGQFEQEINPLLQEI